MAFGIKGPISSGGNPPGAGDQGMVDYALARTYRIVSADRNEMTVSCKICGTTISRDMGHKVQITGLVLRTPKTCHVCPDCFKPIKTASETFPLYHPRPSWWRLLDRKSVEHGEKIPPTTLAADEIEKMIRQREKRRSRA